MKKVKKATNQIMRDFPQLKYYSEPLSFGPVVGGHAINSYDIKTGLNNIILNQDSFSKAEELLSRLHNDYAIGKSYKVKGIESLVAHELGHNAHIALTLKKAGLLYGVPLKGENLFRFNEEYKKIQEEIYSVAFNNENLEEIYEICSKELGSMTVGNARELIAQSFGNYYFGVQQSGISKSIVDYFKKGLK